LYERDLWLPVALLRTDIWHELAGKLADGDTDIKAVLIK